MLEALELRRLLVTSSNGLRWEEFDMIVGVANLERLKDAMLK